MEIKPSWSPDIELELISFDIYTEWSGWLKTVVWDSYVLLKDGLNYSNLKTKIGCM